MIRRFEIMRFNDLEFRKTHKIGTEDQYCYEIVKWAEADDVASKPCCYTLLQWFRTSEGWDIKFVGDRPFTYIERDWPCIGLTLDKFWAFLGYCQAYLNNEFRFEESLKW